MIYADMVIHVMVLVCLVKVLLDLRQIEENLIEEIDTLRQQRSEDAHAYLEIGLNKRLNELQNKRFSHVRILKNEGDK